MGLAVTGLKFLLNETVTAFVKPSQEYFDEQNQRFEEMTANQPEWSRAVSDLSLKLSKLVSQKMKKEEYQGLLGQIKKIIYEDPSLLLPSLESFLKEVVSNVALDQTDKIKDLPPEEFGGAIAIQLISVFRQHMEGIELLAAISDPSQKETAARNFFHKVAEDSLKAILNLKPVDPDLIFIIKDRLTNLLINGNRQLKTPLPVVLLTIYHLYDAGRNCSCEELSKHQDIEAIIEKIKEKIYEKIEKVSEATKAIKISGVSSQTEELIDANVKNLLKGTVSPPYSNPLLTLWSNVEALTKSTLRYMAENIIHPNTPEEISEAKVTKNLAKILNEALIRCEQMADFASEKGSIKKRCWRNGLKREEVHYHQMGITWPKIGLLYKKSRIQKKKNCG